MRKILLTILLSGIWFLSTAQTTSTLPSGYTPFANQLYYKIDGGDTTIISGATSKGFHVLQTTQALRDSLDLYYTKIESDARYVPLTRTLTINGSTQSLIANRTWNVGTVTSITPGYGLTPQTAIISTGAFRVDTLVLDTVYAKIGDIPTQYWQRSGTTLSPVILGDNITTVGNITADSLKRTGGTSSQFLKGDGSVDNTVYGTVASVSGTTNRITSTGGTTPVIDISASYAGQNSITTLGTISTGVWNATNIPVAFGGTNISSYVLGDLLYASGTTTLSRLIGNTSTSFRVLSQTGNGSVSTAPVWSDLTVATITGLQDSLNLKAPKASPIFTGTPSTTRFTIDGYTGGLPASSGSATRGGLRLENAAIVLDFGTVGSGSAWLQVSDEGNYASNFELKLNPNGGNVSVGNLAGTGTRMVVADNMGVISTQAIPGGGGGSVTGVAVATANGLSGTSDGNAVVPTLTLTTSINSPVLAGNGTAILAATTTGSGSTVVLATSPTLTTPNIGSATGSTLALSAVPVMGNNTKFFTMYDAVDAGKLKYAVVDSVKSYLGLSSYAPLASPVFTGTVSGITSAMVGAPSGSGTSTGANTGDQTITLTGAVTGSGTGSFATTLSSGIDATKIADGTVTSTEFQYINSVTSNVQTQLDAKLTASSMNTLTNKSGAISQWTNDSGYLTTAVTSVASGSGMGFSTITGTGTITMGTPSSITSSSTNSTSTTSHTHAITSLPSATTATTQTAGDNSTKVATTAYVDAAVSTIDAGVLSPTLTNTLNLSSATVYIPMIWQRIDNTVSYSMSISVVPAGSGNCEIGIALPVASNFSTGIQAVGTGNAIDMDEIDLLLIQSDSTNDRLRLNFNSPLGANATINITGSYIIVP